MTVQVLPAAIVPPENPTVSVPAVPVTVPPHCGVVTSAAKVIPAGKISVKATSGRASLGFGLVSTKDNILVSSARIVLGLKFFSMVGGKTATRLAVADPSGLEFVPPSVEEINPLMLLCGPGVVAVTVTGISQDELPDSTPPLNEIVSGEEVVSEPPHTAVGPLDVTVTPVGRKSSKASPFNDAVFGLVIVKVKVEVPPTTTGLGEKDFVNAGWIGSLQPVKSTSSRYKSEPGLLFLA